MESLYVVFMRHPIRKFCCAAIFGLTSALAPVWASGLDQANAGIKSLNAGRIDDAIDFLTAGIQSDQLADDQLAMAYHHRGIAHHRRGDTARAILDYTNAMQRGILAEELRPRALNNRAICFELIGDLEAALRDLNRAIALKPDYSDAYVNRASVLRKMQAYGDAAKDYQRASAFGYARQAQIAHGLAQTFEAAGDRAQAARYYRQALAIQPDFPEAQRRLAAMAGPVRMADAGPAIAGRAVRVDVERDAQPASSPETMGENVLRAAIVDNNAPISGSGFAEDSRPTSRGAPARPVAMPTGRGPKGGPEASEFIPVLRDDSITKVPALSPQGPVAMTAAPGKAVEASAQLASYGSEAMARQGWAEIALRFKAELSGAAPRIVAAQIPRKGIVYRLHATGLGASVAATCVKLKRRGQACIPTTVPVNAATPG